MKFVNYTGVYGETVETPSFDTKAEANVKIHEIEEDLYSRPYYLSHGEYDRPTFKAQRYKDGWGIKVFWHYFYGTFNAPTDGRLTSNSCFFDYFFGDEKKTGN